jgi:hypothetical protein
MRMVMFAVERAVSGSCTNTFVDVSRFILNCFYTPKRAEIRGFGWDQNPRATIELIETPNGNK